MFQPKFAERIKNPLYVQQYFLSNIVPWYEMWKNNVEPGKLQMIRPKLIACWIPKATNTESEYVIRIPFFHCDSGCKNAPQCYVIWTLPVLLPTELVICLHNKTAHKYSDCFGVLSWLCQGKCFKDIPSLKNVSLAASS
jgi:hypothetical protein